RAAEAEDFRRFRIPDREGAAIDDVAPIGAVDDRRHRSDDRVRIEIRNAACLEATGVKRRAGRRTRRAVVGAIRRGRGREPTIVWIAGVVLRGVEDVALEVVRTELTPAFLV